MNKREQVKKERFWLQQIAEWKKSGQSQREFCQQNNLKHYQLSYWYNRFNKNNQLKNISNNFIEVQTENPKPNKVEQEFISEITFTIKEICITNPNIDTLQKVLEQL